MYQTGIGPLSWLQRHRPSRAHPIPVVANRNSDRVAAINDAVMATTRLADNRPHRVSAARYATTHGAAVRSCAALEFVHCTSTATSSSAHKDLGALIDDTAGGARPDNRPRPGEPSQPRQHDGGVLSVAGRYREHFCGGDQPVWPRSSVSADATPSSSSTSRTRMWLMVRILS